MGSAARQLSERRARKMAPAAVEQAIGERMAAFSATTARLVTAVDDAGRHFAEHGITAEQGRHLEAWQRGFVPVLEDVERMLARACDGLDRLTGRAP